MLFWTSEVEEKRELLNLVFQNLKLEGKKMLTEVREPFNMMIGYKNCPTNWRWRELNSRPWQTTY
jgi:site-specific DNA recombinase